MNDKIDLVCEYCGVAIGLDDHKCPNCGANCSKIINKYKDLEKKKEEENAAKILKVQEDITNTVLKSFKTSSRVGYIIFGFVVVFIVFIFIMIGVSFFESKKNIKDSVFEQDNKQEVVKVKYNELAVTSDYTIILNDYELFEYKSDNFSNFNTRDGYQKIAFNFLIENKSDDNMYIGGFNEINLTADDYSVEEADLEVNSLSYVVSGKASYDELSNNIINPNSKLQGYVGFEVPVDKKELKFGFNNVVITMDNPAYQE